MKNSKTIEARVYAILIESSKNFFLSVQYAYSLEEAFLLAKMEFIDQNIKIGKPNTVLEGAKIGLFSIRTINDLLGDLDRIPKMEGNSIYPIKEESPKELKLDKLMTEEEIEDLLDSLTEDDMLADIREKKIPKIKKGLPEIKKPVLISGEDFKNNLMKEIIAKKDLKLYEKNKI